MKKVKKIAKRLRARAADLHQMARYPKGDQVAADPTLLLIAEALQEVADQLAPRPTMPRPTKMLKVWMKRHDKKARKAAKKAAKTAKATPPSNNGTTHEPTTARAGVGVGG